MKQFITLGRHVLPLVILLVVGIIVYQKAQSPVHVRRAAFGCGQIVDTDTRIACSIRQHVNMTKRIGTDRTLIRLAELMENPEFAIECHNTYSKVGGQAYEQHINHHRFAFTRGSALCDYGFYHGFLEAYVGREGYSRDLLSFCHDMSQTLGGNGAPGNPLLECFHGIGHGIAMHGMDETHDKQVLLQQATTACEKLPSHHDACVLGAEEAVVQHDDWPVELFHDPFLLCKGLPASRLFGCFTTMISAYYRQVHYNFEQTGRFIETIADKQLALDVMDFFGNYPTHRYSPGQQGQKHMLLQCRLFDGSLALSCMKGFARLVLRSGTRATAEKRATRLCQESGLQSDEQIACMKGAMQILKRWLSEKERNAFCRTLGDPLNAVCREREPIRRQTE